MKYLIIIGLLLTATLITGCVPEEKLNGKWGGAAKGGQNSIMELEDGTGTFTIHNITTDFDYEIRFNKMKIIAEEGTGVASGTVKIAFVDEDTLIMTNEEDRETWKRYK